MAGPDVDGLNPYIARMRRENKVEAEYADRLHAAAYEEAWRLGREMGRADASLAEVVLFGSALPGRAFRRDSDIDLGIRGGNRVLLEHVVVDSSFAVDLIDLEDARPGIVERIEKEGVVVYAAPEN